MVLNLFYIFNKHIIKKYICYGGGKNVTDGARILSCTGAPMSFGIEYEGRAGAPDAFIPL